MITLELAQKLKVAGLMWEPKCNDIACVDGESGIHRVRGSVDEYTMRMDEINESTMWGTTWYREYVIWLPSLSQLLAEIEARGGWYQLTCKEEAESKYEVYAAFCVKRSEGMHFKSFFADTPEEAAGLALLWILKQGVVDES